MSTVQQVSAILDDQNGVNFPGTLNSIQPATAASIVKPMIFH
jgi:hypothetical protein